MTSSRRRYRQWIVLVAALLMISCAIPANKASASQDARGAWASIAASYNFNESATSAFSTFADEYNGENLSQDFDGALAATAGIMGTPVPPYEPGDIMSASLTNWPDP